MVTPAIRFDRPVPTQKAQAAWVGVRGRGRWTCLRPNSPSGLVVFVPQGGKNGPVSPDRPLHVFLPSIPGQRWSCHSCGDCCRTLVGHLFEHERQRLEAQNWQTELGKEPYVRAGGSSVLNKRADGACVFLDAENRCRIHSRFGEEAKPLACRVFPFSIRPAPGGWQASLRFDCPSVIASRGQPVRDFAPFLREIAAELEAPGRATALFGRQSSPRRTELASGLVATEEEIAAIESRLTRWLSRDDLPISRRMIVAARWTTALASAKLEKVREKRFAELLDVLIGGLAAECESPPKRPTARQIGMLRQFVFACGEHVALNELRAGLTGKMALRWRQLGAARAFLRGVGTVPPTAGFPAGVTFQAVEPVRPARDDEGRIAELLHRYLVGRVEGRTLFGEGYYGWPAFRGLAALWEAVAGVGWLARAFAAAAGRPALEFEDVASAIGIIDRALGRLPALGSMAERGRVTYLLADDGLARLLSHYAIVSS